jgi:hypothetical protein
MSRSQLLTTALRACLCLILFVTSNSQAASCGGEIAWSAGCIGDGPGTLRTHGGNLWSVGNWWECTEPGTGGSWTDMGACSAAPGLSTVLATGIAASVAQLNGNVTTDNGFAITARGFIYYTVEANVNSAAIGTPGLTSVVTHGTSSTGVYDIDISGLSRNVTYYFKSYATNASGTNYGSTLSFTTTNTGITFTSNANGAWNTTTIWTPNGTPNLDGSSPFDTVIVTHDVSYTANLQLEDGSVLETTAGGHLTLTGNITQAVSGVTGSLINAGTITGSGTYTPTGANGIFTNSGDFNFSTWSGANSWDMSSSGNITITGGFTHAGTGTLNTTGGTVAVNSLTIGPSGAAISLAGTTLNVAANIAVIGSGNLNSDAVSAVNVVGNYTNTGSVSSTFGGTMGVTGNYTNSGSATVTVGGAMTVGGNVSGTGSGNLTINGTIDITGQLTLSGSAWLNGTGVVKYNGASLNVQGQSSTGYIVCVDNSKWDSQAGANGSDFTPFNPFNLSACGSGVLPIELLSFDVEVEGSYVDIKWVTGQELNSDYFEVQVSIDGLNWNVLEKVKAKGNSFSAAVYYSADENLNNYDQKYYRIKEVSFTGVNYYSPLVVAKFNSKGRIVSLYDNGSQLKIAHDIEGQSIICSLYNLQGDLIYIKSVAGSEHGLAEISIPSHHLTTGIYFVSLNAANHVVSKKVFINKLSMQ